jgi:hypothetical protein
MPTTYAGELASDLPVDDLPLGANVSIDDVEYGRIMGRIGLVDGELGTSVSRFNSSI